MLPTQWRRFGVSPLPLPCSVSGLAMCLCVLAGVLEFCFDANCPCGFCGYHECKLHRVQPDVVAERPGSLGLLQCEQCISLHAKVGSQTSVLCPVQSSVPQQY